MKRLHNVAGNQELNQMGAEGLILIGLLLFPNLWAQMLEKTQAYKNDPPTLAHFKNHQKSSWSEILTHSIFTSENEDLENSLEESLGIPYEGLQKLFLLYVERTNTLWK